MPQASFIRTSLEGWPTKARETASSHEVRLTLDQPSISRPQEEILNASTTLPPTLEFPNL